jgi:Transcriptional regulators
MDKRTIYQIAEQVGVSASTVSRALSGRGYCSAKNKAKIIEAAEALNYAPNQSAIMLKNQKTNKVLFAVPDICNPFYFEMINGINKVLEQHGYLLILLHTKHSLKEELRAIQNVREHAADGLIMVSFHFNEDNIQAINALSAPVVLTNKYVSADGNDRFDYVYVDTYEGTRQSTRHLIEEGYRRIAYIGGQSNEQTGHERLCGYRDALAEAGMPYEEPLVMDADYTEKGGYAAAQQLLPRRPDAIVAANDLMALGVMQACEEAGIRVPDELAIVGMDNLDLAARVHPKLSSVYLQQEEIGRVAAQLLIDRLNGHSMPRGEVRLEPQLIKRQSSLRRQEQKG